MGIVCLAPNLAPLNILDVKNSESVVLILFSAVKLYCKFIFSIMPFLAPIFGSNGNILAILALKFGRDIFISSVFVFCECVPATEKFI